MERRNLKLIIAMAIAVAVAVAMLFVGYYISGADILAWLTSKYAITLYIAFGLFVIVWAVLLLRERNARL